MGESHPWRHSGTKRLVGCTRHRLSLLEETLHLRNRRGVLGMTVCGRSARLILFLGAAAALAGCLKLPQQERTDAPKLLQRAALAGGNVVVVPPQGYCIQPATLREKPKGGFALLASCESISGYSSGYKVAPLVMTVSAVARSEPGPEPQGDEIARALAGHKVIQQLHGDGLTAVQVIAQKSLTEADDPQHWRGVMVVNQTTVGLAVYGPKGSEATREKGLNMMIWLAEQIRDSSPKPAVGLPPLPGVARGVIRPVARPGGPVPDAPRGAPVSQRPVEPRRKTFFSRIFG